MQIGSCDVHTLRTQLLDRLVKYKLPEAKLPGDVLDVRRVVAGDRPFRLWRNTITLGNPLQHACRPDIDRSLVRLADQVEREITRFRCVTFFDCAPHADQCLGGID